MSKRGKNNQKTKERRIVVISAVIVVLIAIIIAIIFAVVNRSEKNSGYSADDIQEMIDIPEGSNVDDYVDEEGRVIVRVTDKDGNIIEYYINEEGYLVRRVVGSVSDGDDSEDKIIEDYDDADGNHVHNIILPDGTIITETTTPNGDVNQSVTVPESSLTKYISYGNSSSNEIINTPERAELDYSSIVGFAPMYSSSEDSNVVYGVELPYYIGDTGMSIMAIGTFSGPYVEDGSDTEVESVAAMIITNTSDEMIQYSALTFEVKRGNDLKFVVTNLPANTSVMVLESNKTTLEGTETISYKDNVTAYMERNMHSSEVTVSASDNLITLTNNSDKTIDTAYVYYKLYAEGGIYLGGITYRTKFEDIAPGAVLTQGASHYFVNNSQVLTVDMVYEE